MEIFFFSGEVNKTRFSLQVHPRQFSYHIYFKGKEVLLSVYTKRVFEFKKIVRNKNISKPVSKILSAPMSGLLISLKVKEGDKVKAGDELAIVEAMKMENTLYASRDSIISRIKSHPGDTLIVDQIILTFE